ncbi:mucin-associated surface protein [Trypanosoma cruzi]|nr:mucin-associated surface protein [Trypanosoma cruzi]
MAMMMTGRVLLVCALCVLWCGSSGITADGDEDVARPLSSTGDSAFESNGKVLQESQILVPGGSQNLGLEAHVVNGRTGATHIEAASTEEEASSDEEDEDEEVGGLNPSGEGEILSPSPPSPPSQEDNEKLKNIRDNGLQPENKRQDGGGKQIVDEAEVTKLIKGEPQPQGHGNPLQRNGTKSGEQQMTQGKGRQTNVEGVTARNPAGDHSTRRHKSSEGSKDEKEGEEGGVEGNEKGNEMHRAQEGEKAAHVSGAPKVISAGIQQEVQRTHTGETPPGIKIKAEEKEDTTEEEREEQKKQNQENPPGKEQETITGANATNQINTTSGDSDGSTAVSHTTSPLLLLLVVACAAAAAVVAA